MIWQDKGNIRKTWYLTPNYPILFYSDISHVTTMKSDRTWQNIDSIHSIFGTNIVHLWDNSQRIFTLIRHNQA